MAPAEGADDKAEPNVAAQALQSSDGSDGGASDEKEDEEETKFVEWDPSGRFGRVRSRPPVFFSAQKNAKPRVSPPRMKTRRRRRPGAAPALDDALGFRARARRAGLFPPSRAARLADAFLFPLLRRRRNCSAAGRTRTCTWRSTRRKAWTWRGTR